MDKNHILPIGEASHLGQLPLRFRGGMWSTTRMIAGEAIVFEAPTQLELRDAIAFTIEQQLTYLNDQAARRRSVRRASTLLKLLFPFLARGRAVKAGNVRFLHDRGRRDPAGATGVQRPRSG